MTVLVQRIIDCHACDVALMMNKRDVARFFVQAIPMPNGIESNHPNRPARYSVIFRVESYREYLRVAKAFAGTPATEEQFHAGDLG